MSALRLALSSALVLAAAAAWARTPLHDAAARGDAEFVRQAIAGKRNLNVTYDEPMRALEGNYARTLGVTPLMIAAHFGQLEVAKLLVEGGADLYLESRWPGSEHRRNAFDYAVEQKRVEVARYLWSKGDHARLGVRVPQHLGQACSAGCGAQAKNELALFLIGLVPDAAAAPKEMGNAVCQVARSQGGIAFLEAHLARVPRSSLHCVAYGPYADAFPLPHRLAVASWLIDHGADPNDRSFPFTPLAGAAFNHNLEMAKLLVARGADPNLRAAEGSTPIGAAANSCIHGTDNRFMPRQVAMVEYLAGVSDRSAYASAESRSKLQLLNKCCAQPESAEQRRICAAFGL